MDTPQNLPVLNDQELRVLGALMEKSKTTPDYYPMTLNSLTAACNQKTARKPVVDYTENDIALTLDTLKRKGLISTATGGSSRAVKYKHNFAIVYPVVPAELAIICLLILRGPQTPGEINTNAGRLYEFDDLDEVQTILEKLGGGDMPYLLQMPKRPGQKEARYRHLLGGTIADDEPDETDNRPSPGLETRLAKVELELAELKEAFDKLMRNLPDTAVYSREIDFKHREVISLSFMFNRCKKGLQRFTLFEYLYFNRLIIRYL